MPWNLWGKPFIFCLVQQFKEPTLQAWSIQKTSKKTRRTTLTATTHQCLLPGTCIGSSAAQMTPAPRSSCHLHRSGGTSIILPICCTDKPRIKKQGKLNYRTAQKMARTRAANTIRPGKCCKSNTLLLPSTLPTKLPLRLAIVFTSLQLWSHWDGL